MTIDRENSRRHFLRLLGAGALVLKVGRGPLARATASAGSPTRRRIGSRPGRRTAAVRPDVDLALRAIRAAVPVLPGRPTRVWSYAGEILEGAPENLQALPDSYLGPRIRVRRGQRVRVRFTNELDEPTIVHWHGLDVPADMDGHPRSVIGPGDTFVYEFEVTNRAGPYWYHPHPHERTGPQVYRGLAGLFHVTDDEEAAAGLPTGDHDVPLVIQDRTFDSENQLVYTVGGMMGAMTGFLGERILVNGRPDVTLSVARRPYRLRLLNGSNARIYKLAWDDGSPLTVVGTDGGLLESPVQRDYVTLAPGERLDLWCDFSALEVGARRTLRSLAFSGAGMMGPGTGPGAALPNGAPFDVLQVQAEPTAALRHRVHLPSVLDRSAAPVPVVGIPGTDLGLGPRDRESSSAAAGRAATRQVETVRTFRLASQMMAWTLNGRTFEMDGVAPDEIVPAGATEEWEFINVGGMGMGGMGATAHPMHIHGRQFRVVERNVERGAVADWETVRHGYVDEGWKDTLLVMPGERVRVRLTFSDHQGLFLYHCHNLEHEDMGMMRNFLVSAPSKYAI